MWEKYTNWELATRVPFILAVPWLPATHGAVSHATCIRCAQARPSLRSAEPRAPEDSRFWFSGLSGKGSLDARMRVLLRMSGVDVPDWCLLS